MGDIQSCSDEVALRWEGSKEEESGSVSAPRPRALGLCIGFQSASLNADKTDEHSIATSMHDGTVTVWLWTNVYIAIWGRVGCPQESLQQERSRGEGLRKGEGECTHADLALYHTTAGGFHAFVGAHSFLCLQTVLHQHFYLEWAL